MAKEAVLDEQSIRNTLVAATGELIGTLLLVYVGTQTAVNVVLAAPFAGQPLGSLSIALAFAATLTILVYVIGPITGGHFNPVVTLMLYLFNEVRGKTALWYVVAQAIGGTLASLLVLSVNDARALTVAGLGVTQPSPGVGTEQVVMYEAAGSFILLFVVTGIVTSKRVSQATSGIVVGLALFVGIAAIGPYTGGGINPFRTIPAMVVSGRTDDLVAYVAAQVVGGALGAFAFKLISLAKTPPA